MRLLVTSLLVILAAAAGMAQQATFRSATRIVPVLTTVTDAQGRLVPSLERDQFTILDNAKPQEISFFLNEVQPFTAVVMLDFSASMTANLDNLFRRAPLTDADIRILHGVIRALAVKVPGRK